jgi:UDP-N-acetylglucosamine acyltransferase
MSLVSISPKAKIGKNVIIREFTVIEDDVEIGDNVEIGPSAFIGNGARIADNVRILHASSIGVWPNSFTYNNENTTTEIGEGTFIKGQTTICRGTKYSYKTVIGKNCYIMNHVHIGHDNIIGDNVTLTNLVNLGGHVEIGEYANLGGVVGVHQFSKIGKHTMIESSAKVQKDVPPYILAGRDPLRYLGLNVIGLKRRGFSADKIAEIKEVYRVLYSAGLNFSDAIIKIKSDFELNDEVNEILNFIEKSNRGILRK